jgi:hypothetical protein
MTVAELLDRITALEKERDALSVSLNIAWNDRQDEWSAEIEAAHPTLTSDFDTYAKAQRMVSNRHSKGSLIALVNWLLALTDRTEGGSNDGE